jgi:large repetitive protein
MKKLLLFVFAIFCGVTLSGQGHSRSKDVRSGVMSTKAVQVTTAKKFNNFSVSVPVVYTNEAAFLAAVGSKNYLEDFNSYSLGTINQSSVTLTSGQFGYTITAPVDNYIYSVEGAIGTNYDLDTLVFTNNKRHINYFGARLYTLDLPYTFVSGPMSVVVGDYTYNFTCTDQVSFLGFVFTDSIPSFGIVGGPAGYAWPIVDHLYVGDNKNYPPVITSVTGALTTAEDTPITLSLTDVTFKDVDMDDPMSLVVQTGTNYTFNGTVVTPATDFNGTLQVGVKVSDGTALSEIAYITINVTPVNDPPVIASSKELTTPEETPLTIKLSDLTITDVDGDNAFTFNVLSGTNYTVNGSTITPVADFNGILQVAVTASDASGATSATAYIKVTVTPVNDPPVITGTIPASTPEDTPLTLTMSNVVASDIDGDVLSLVVQSGTNYTFTGNTVTPAANYNGDISVAVRVSDGTTTSGIAYVTVTVTPVNDAPVITATNTLTTAEETPITINLSDVTVSDVDGDTSFSLTVAAGTNYTFTGNTITPALDFNGTLQVAVTVSDGIASSAVAYVPVNVTAVNDAPVISATSIVTTNEDTPVTITLSDVTATDVDGDVLTLVVEGGLNYTFSGNTITPALNYNGNLSVPVKVSDPSGAYASATVTVKVNPVNDAPVITATSTVTTAEDTPVTLTLSDITASDVDGDALTIEVQSGTNYTFSGATVTPAANFNGTLTVVIKVSDGITTSASANVTVIVTAVNDAPVITATGTVTTPEDAPVALNLSDVTVSDVDGDTSFSLTVAAGTNYTFSGNTITPALNFNGNLQVAVTVSDGIASSAVAYISVTVTAVNDAPVITSTAPVTATQSQLYTYTVIATDVDNTTLTYSISGQPAGMTVADNVISWTPGSGVITSGEITLTVSDGSLSATQKFTITVTPASAINETTADTFTISPNPATDRIKIKAGVIITSVQIIDITGKVISKQICDDNEVSIDVDNLSNGLYFVKVKLGDGFKVKKLIKQ